MPDADWTKSTEYSIDPFPGIAPSLLNSADILRYAKEGCLIHPFNHDDQSLLNPATYTIRFLGKLYSWEEDETCEGNRLRKQDIREDTSFRMRANSICYLETEEQFRLPQYIAARFNLHIRYVHKGILLGTGPIVDPGFSGSLLIPLHNLTSNDYELLGGDHLLWVEFTKLTSHVYWKRSHCKLDTYPPKDLKVLNTSKTNRTAHKYFENSGVHNSGVVSAFRGALDDLRSKAKMSEDAAKKAASSAQQIRKRFTIGGIIGGIISAITVFAAVIYPTFQIVQSSNEMVGKLKDDIDKLEKDLNLMRTQIEVQSHATSTLTSDPRARPR